MALIRIANGEIATVVTTLEMTARPPPRAMPDADLRLVAWPAPAASRYRMLFTRIGAPWLWFSRLALDEAALTAIVHDPAVAIFAAVDRAGIEVGMIELDFRHAGESELRYFGIVPELTGKGLGRWLMAHALAQAWRPGVARLRLNTCTLDHPSALGFYRAQGFVPVARTVETFADPRATGLLPPDSAPQVPLLAIRR